MKTVILAGGFGTRIAEESVLRPKPMLEIGGQPILWHIMKQYAHYGYHDFIICLGFRGYVIKEYFADYFLHTSDVTMDLAHNRMTVHSNYSEPWQVTLVDTGLHTMTGGRIKRVQPYIGHEPFMLTYGDGVSDVDIGQLVQFHQSHGKTATITAVQPEGRFGIVELEQDRILSFREKSKNDTGWTNAGFMVFEPDFFDSIQQDDTVMLEKEPLEALTKAGEMMAYKHSGFWQCMDTPRDRKKLEDLWDSGNAPWKVW